MVLVFWLGISSPCFSQPRNYREAVKPYNGMVERGYNRGPFIDSANRKYAYLGAPYCASSVSLILDKAKAVYPTIRSGRAKAFITKESINARLVWEGKSKIPSDAVVIFTRKGGGHIEFYISDSAGIMRCFGFNTSPDGNAGSQWNGNWSGYKKRNMKKLLSPYNVFRVTHFTPVKNPVISNRCAYTSRDWSIYSAPVTAVRVDSIKPYNRFRYDGNRANSHSPSRYSVFGRSKS
jgi:hypothetical protein